MDMKKLEPKKLRTDNPKPLVKKRPSKPTGLSKDDKDYYSKIGRISAKKRKMTSEDFAAMARLSHPRKRGQSKGGRPPKAA
jgi:hypothetical protein